MQTGGLLRKRFHPAFRAACAHRYALEACRAYPTAARFLDFFALLVPRTQPGGASQRRSRP